MYILKIMTADQGRLISHLFLSGSVIIIDIEMLMYLTNALDCFGVSYNAFVYEAFFEIIMHHESQIINH